MMISGIQVQKPLCLHVAASDLDPARHEEAAIYEVNQRIPNVIGLRSNPVISIAAQKASSEAAVLARGGF